MKLDDLKENTEFSYAFLRRHGWIFVLTEGGAFLGWWHLEWTAPQKRYVTEKEALEMTPSYVKANSIAV